MPRPTNPLIYAVDDNQSDLLLLQRVFKNYFEECALRLFNNGSDLLTYLTHQLDQRLPDLIILDLELPIYSGFELLHILKNNEDFRLIPIYILSASRHKESIERCSQLGSSNYLHKDKAAAQLISCVQSLHADWVGEQKKQESIKLPLIGQLNFVNRSQIFVN